MPPTELELGALRSWTPAQQAAHYHRHFAEQEARDKAKAEKDEQDKKKKKKEEKNAVEPDEVLAEKVVGDLLQGWCPALYEFLDIFGPPHTVLPVFVLLHIGYAIIAPWPLLPLLPLPLSHLLPMLMSLKSLFAPSTLLDKAYEDAKKAWRAETDALRKKDKDKAEFPDPPAPPQAWQVCARDRMGWAAWWAVVGAVDYLEVVCFGEQYGGLVWWPRMKAVACIALYCVWETDDKGKMVTGAMKLVEPFLPETKEKSEKKSKSSSRGADSGGGSSSR